MRLVISDTKALKSIVDSISSLIDEAKLVISPESISMRAMDPAHVVLVDLNMSKVAFEEYRMESNLELGIDFDRLNTILKRAGSSDKIELSLSEDSSALIITIRNSAMRRFDLPLIDVSEEELRIPQLDFLAEVEVDPKILSEGIKDAEIVSDHVILRCDSENLYISASGDLGNVEVKVSKERALNFEVSEPCKSIFSIEYLKDMLKAVDAASTIRLHLGTDIPMRLDFLAEGVKLDFLLAPRIEG
jgi:proliferating cell nuclear antigen